MIHKNNTVHNDLMSCIVLLVNSIDAGVNVWFDMKHHGLS